MPRQPSARARPRDELREARTRAYGSYHAARAAGGITALSANRLWADTLLTMRNQTKPTQTEMLVRTAALFDLLVDRAGWPGR